MHRIELQKHARPDLACALVDAPDVGEPGPGEAVVSIRAAAINPADLLIFEGRYPGPDTLPAPVGIEGAGVMDSVGAGVTNLVPGDHVLSLGRANWAEKIRAETATLIRLPKALSLRDAAQLKANPPTARLMLSTYEDLQPGDWVIQNAANSAVGRHVIRFAQARGIKTVNIVRREALIPELKALGADVVVVDRENLAEAVRSECGADANIRLGIDAVCGRATQTLANCMSDGGTIVTYGFISGEPCRITPHHLVIHQLTLKGFWLVDFMRSSERVTIEAMYADVSQAFIDGVLVAPVEAEYGLDRIGEALAHAHREARSGKILLTPNGALD